MPSRYQFFMGGLDSLLTTLQTNAAEFYEWWTSIDTTYRATGCLLTSFFLMWEATKATSEARDRKFFVTGIAALGLLGYGAVLFTHGTVR
jgi:hypothetical protein